jgi:hypothetical protein
VAEYHWRLTLQQDASVGWRSGNSETSEIIDRRISVGKVISGGEGGGGRGEVDRLELLFVS